MLEVRDLLIDISKALDKVWHEVLSSNGICSNFL